MYIKNILSIAGTDPTSGAGIQADLKTFSALGAYGTTVITSLLAQNTCGVQSIYPIKPEFVIAQLDAVLNDIHIDSIKIGLLCQGDIIHAVADKLKEYSIPWLVLDTVILSKRGDILLDKNAICSLKNKLIPISSIITPNILEAATLLECKPAQNDEQIINQGYQLLQLGCQAVVIKGGHLTTKNSSDWLITANQEVRFDSPRINICNTHGTGCTLSAALAALRPCYSSWAETLQAAKLWVYKSLLHSNILQIGKGIGPVHHFHEWW